LLHLLTQHATVLAHALVCRQESPLLLLPPLLPWPPLLHTPGTETLQLWDWLAATDESVQGGDVAVADLTEARQLAAAAASSSGAVAAALQQVGAERTV
jgi:hypothetical protein